MKLSVIIPYYNAEDTLAEHLDAPTASRSPRSSVCRS